MNKGFKDLIFVVIWLVNMFIFAIPLIGRNLIFISKETVPFWIALIINGVIFTILIIKKLPR